MKTKKLISIFLSLSIVFSLFAAPVHAYAEELPAEEPVVEEPIIEEPIVEEPAVEPAVEPTVEPTIEPTEEPVVEEPVEEQQQLRLTNPQPREAEKIENLATAFSIVEDPDEGTIIEVTNPEAGFHYIVVPSVDPLPYGMFNNADGSKEVVELNDASDVMALYAEGRVYGDTKAITAKDGNRYHGAACPYVLIVKLDLDEYIVKTVSGQEGYFYPVYGAYYGETGYVFDEDFEPTDPEATPTPPPTEPTPTTPPTEPTPTPAPTHTHSWSTSWNYDETYHWHECTVDGCNSKSGYADHSYGTGNTCVCGFVNTSIHIHVWSNEWSSLEGMHWHECIGAGECDIKYNLEKDSYEACVFKASANNICICGAEKPSGHVHKWTENYSHANGYHWHRCNNTPSCTINSDNSKKAYYEEHNFSDPNVGLGICICGVKSSHKQHTWATTYSYDENGHYYDCTEAGCYLENVDKEGYEEHTIDETTGECDTCAYVKPHEHSWTEYTFEDDYHWVECAGKYGPCTVTDNTKKPGYGTHTPNLADGVCSVGCGHVTPHEHIWEQVLKNTDPDAHWYECTGEKYGPCTETDNTKKPGYALHDLSERGLCADCNYQAPHEHVWADAWSTSFFNHWHVCVGKYNIDEGKVCEVVDLDVLGTDGFHSYDATTNTCECGKVKPTDDVLDTTVENTNYGDAFIVGDVADYEAKVLEDWEMNLHEDFGLGYRIWLEVAEKSVSTAELELIKAKLGDYNIIKHLEVDLWKQMYSAELDIDFDPEKVTEMSGEVTIKIELPKDITKVRGKRTRDLAVIRVHNGVAEVIDSTYNRAEKTLTFETDKFSTYTIVYKDTKEPEKDSGTTQQAILDNSQNMGDNNFIPVVVAIAVASGLAFTVVSRIEKRKEENLQ